MLGRFLLIFTLCRLGLSGPEDDTLEECWLADPSGSKSLWAQECCRPKPCGQAECWVPPTFTYEFCCDVNACRPSITEEVKAALDVTVESLPNPNASVLAFRRAPEAFRALLKLDVRLSTDRDQACTCAVASAAVALLWWPEQSAKLATAIGPRWFVDGIDWGKLLTDGWGGIFGWLDRLSPDDFGGSTDSFHEDDLVQRQQGLAELIVAEQEKARKVLKTLESSGEVDISGLLSALRQSGSFRRVWQLLRADVAWRKHGQKCMASLDKDTLGRWKCEPWTYHIDANFSSILPKYQREKLPGLGNLGESNVAVCVLGAPRTVVKTYPSIRNQVVKVLKGDVFVYFPFPGLFTPALESDLRELGPVVTALLVPDVNRTAFEARVVSELKNPKYYLLYGLANGPWRAPLHKQMGSSMWGYHNQHGCRRMVESFEQQRGYPYEWIVFARAEMFWAASHPPVEVLDPRFVHIPLGQDNNNYNHNGLKGINDRHAVVPKRWFLAYFNRYESILDGSAWRYLSQIYEAGYLINTEQYLWLHLQSHQVQVRRFPPVSFLSHCTEGPQCQHLYKGTNLKKVRWTSTAKYFTEVVEARRTIVDDFHYVRRFEHGWIWQPFWPHATWHWGSLTKEQRTQPLQEVDPQELLRIDVVCGLSKSGPISSLRWVFFKRCECHAPR